MPRRANAYLGTRHLRARPGHPKPRPARGRGRGLRACLTALLVLLAGPAVAVAGSGGSGIAPGGNRQAQPANRTVTSTVDGITITTRASGFYRRRLRFTGSVSRRYAGHKIVIERSGGKTGGAWVATASSQVRANGHFSARWQATHAGQLVFRAVLPSSQAARDASAWPTVQVIVYKLSVATYYGPGFWGNRTACGRVLRHKTLGVANRTLPCGTHVSIYYGGRSIVVPVIDRGPYANGANWDLTEATARALHMTETETVGAARVPKH